MSPQARLEMKIILQGTKRLAVRILLKMPAPQTIRSVAHLKLGATGLLPEEANVYAGCMEELETNPMLDAGAGPKAGVDAFGFFKVETGGAVYDPNYWHAFSQFGDTPSRQVTELSALQRNNLSGIDWKSYDPTTGNGLLYKMVAEWMALGIVSATVFEAEVRFLLSRETAEGSGQFTDEVLVAKHRMHGTYAITATTSDLMNHGVTLLNTAAVTELDVDFVKCTQLR